MYVTGVQSRPRSRQAFVLTVAPKCQTWCCGACGLISMNNGGGCAPPPDHFEGYIIYIGRETNERKG